MEQHETLLFCTHITGEKYRGKHVRNTDVLSYYYPFFDAAETKIDKAFEESCSYNLLTCSHALKVCQ